ncbi:OmpP1/FadL family transporter [Tenacibaculum sp. UWU-22]|uniref:OmpP1/FadL family transporter n=1 Tax=Tenacibaculum sp. UWU-22 TaxID=3234187 RepID=UPI0034DB54BE
MKKIILLAIIIASGFTSFSQSLGYNDLGVLFGQDHNYGSSRFNAMSGAFGALGSDVSSLAINPAGTAVALNSTFSITLGNRNNCIDATYYGNTTNTQDNFFNISQVGSILSFSTNNKTNWNRFALSFNYRIKNDFDGDFNLAGNSGQALFNQHPNDTSDPKTPFNNAQQQRFANITNGETSALSFGFSAAHLNKLFLGVSLNFHDIHFTQTTQLREVNNDDNGNTLRAYNEQISYFGGSGFSLGLGFIYKPEQNFRLGLSYESPTWYQEINEDNNLAVFDPNDSTYDDWLGYTEISSNNISPDINSGEYYSTYIYNLKTPSKLTISGAFIFNKDGLISIDYSYKNYKNTRFSSGDFFDVNNNYTNSFRSTHAINIGTEWLFNNLSVRGGYHYEQTPYKDVIDTDNIDGFSLGLGYRFKNMKFDFAYSNSTYTSPYAIYNSPYVNVNSAELNTNISRITGTLTFNL